MTDPRDAVAHPINLGRHLQEELQDGTMHPAFVEQSQTGYVLLALIERIKRLELVALLVESPETTDR